MFTALDRESKVGGIPDLLAVVDVLRGCGVIAFGELNIDGPDPVSYTHLDVYKRQVYKTRERIHRSILICDY